MPITATAQPANTPPRVELKLADVEGTSVTILRNDPDGRSRPVRTAEPATLTGGAWTGFDYEAPLGQAVTYTLVSDTVQTAELLTSNQRTFESGTALGWLGFGNTTVAQTTALARSGTGSLSMTAVAAGSIQATTNTSAAAVPPVMSATPGVTYTGSVWMRAATTARTCALRMGFFDSVGAQIGTYTVGTSAANTTSGWTQFTVTAVAPANTARLTIYAAAVSAAQGEVHYIDDASVTYVTTSTTEVSTAVTLDVADIWLVHPGIPDLSVRVPADMVQQLDERTVAARSAVLQPLGRVTPIVVSDVRSAPQTGLAVFTETADARNALRALLARGQAVLVNIPLTLGWGVTYEWAAIGDVTEAYFNRGLSESRIFTLPYHVVDRPVGGLAAQWTYTDMHAASSSYAAVVATYATYSDIVAVTPT